MEPIAFLLVGLGNPGPKYARTRHNIGFEIIDTLAQGLPNCSFKTKFQSLLADTKLEIARVLLAKPQTFMNLSGQSVSEVSNFYKLNPDQIVVIFDDLDLPEGEIRIRKKGGDGGHNGMKSIIENLGTQDFPRIRIGIGRSADAADHVLAEFSKAERELFAKTLTRAVQAVTTLVSEGIDKAMNTFNRKDLGTTSES